MIRLVYVIALVGMLTRAHIGLAADQPSAAATPVPKDQAYTVLFFGNSLTAGYGLDASQAFPALIQGKITARGWPFKVVNAGLSGDTTAAGLRRIDWLLQRPVTVLVLELGINDGLRGLPLDEVKKNLQTIIDRTRHKYPQAALVLAGMQLPPNFGPEYRRRFQRLFPELAAANGAALIPFLLEGVGGVPDLNLPDGIHPTAAGHQIIAENVWPVLEPVLQKVVAPGPEQPAR